MPRELVEGTPWKQWFLLCKLDSERKSLGWGIAAFGAVDGGVFF